MITKYNICTCAQSNTRTKFNGTAFGVQFAVEFKIHSKSAKINPTMPTI